MEKKNLVSLMMGTVGLMIFALGMCMSLVPQWQALSPGIWLGLVGVLILAAMVLVRRKMEQKPLIAFTMRHLAIAALGLAGALTLGLGMCLVMVWPAYLIWGIIIGCAGIMLLVSLIPVCKGIK